MQGLTLAIPEMVPFRLTQNLVDAFGVSGYEGAFRRACEVTLQVYTGLVITDVVENLLYFVV